MTKEHKHGQNHDRQTDRQTDRIVIIVPVYNCKKYLSRCLNSLLNQTYSNLHIILIDDGSTDGSGSVCEAYADKDNRFKVIHQNNRGVSEARNKGLESSDEDYVMFVDADDYVGKTYVYDLYRGVIDHNADLSITPGFDEDETGNPTRPWNENDESHKMTANQYDWNGPEQHPFVWGAMFKRSVIGDIRFDSEYYVGEDSLFFAQYMKKVRTLYYVHKPLYHYVHYTKSAIHGAFDSKKITELYAWKEICKEYGNRNELAAAYATRIKDFSLQYYKNSDFHNQYFRNVVSEYRKHCGALLKEYRNDKRNKALLSAIYFYLLPDIFCKIKSR